MSNEIQLFINKPKKKKQKMLKAVILVLEFNEPFHKLIPNEKWQKRQPKEKKGGRGGGRRHRKKN
jgi:hypothetical protein